MVRTMISYFTAVRVYGLIRVSRAPSPVDMRNYSPSSAPLHIGLHVFDTYKNELSGLNDRPFSKHVFDPIEKLVPEIVKCPEWGKANAAFHALERDAETAIRSLLQQVNSKPRFSQLSGLNWDKRGMPHSEKPKLNLGRHALISLQKYLLFLRFRNCDDFQRLLKLASSGYRILFSMRDWSFRNFQRLFEIGRAHV